MSEERKLCLSCGEPVKPGWKICPACESPLSGAACPGCGRPVKEYWKRCPECEAPLLCRSCGRRLTSADGPCPDCLRENEKSGIPVSDDRFVEPVTGMAFIHLPGGRYLMGDTFGEGVENEQPVHTVRLTDFFIAETCITQAQWNRLVEENPSRFPGRKNPVENVTYAQVHAFIDKLCTASGGRRFALPTEAQWEYAARSGGKDDRYAGGDDIDGVAWYAENSGGKPQPVAGRNPNRLGLYDMSGNVLEWCRDSFRKDAYLIHHGTDPVIEDDGAERVIRGGSWNLDAWSARCARRFAFRETDCGPGLGFRLVLAANRQEDGAET
jgi:formylglycine-generating enzyme required for sulfatase activity